jgi:adenylate cyclase
MLSPKTKRNISRIIPFGVIWMIFGIIYTQVEKGILGDLDYYPSTGNPYDFTDAIWITPVTAFISGLGIGTLEILYLSKLFARKSFGKKIQYKSIIYLVVILSFLFFLSAIASAFQLNTNPFDQQVLNNVGAFFSTYAFLSVGFFMALTIIVSQFYTEVSESLGHGVLNNFFTGKYHNAQEEERIFMFLDMKSSTAIAERLGHVKYFSMLRHYYSDLSNPIIKYSGEIYQYVGDEIVVSWKLKNGLRNNNCIHCFVAMKRSLKKQMKKYNEKFGVIPGFKAGFHVGKVTTGEIGIIKKDIIFTGDVLNTTARIEALCNPYNVDILISGQLMKKLQPDSHFNLKSLGEHELRGRDEKIELFTILQN